MFTLKVCQCLKCSVICIFAQSAKLHPKGSGIFAFFQVSLPHTLQRPKNAVTYFVWFHQLQLHLYLLFNITDSFVDSGLYLDIIEELALGAYML